jgi:hypothetical protein
MSVPFSSKSKRAGIIEIFIFEASGIVKLIPVAVTI